MTRFRVVHSGALPTGTDKSAAVALLHNHGKYFEADEHYRWHKDLPAPAASTTVIPQAIQPRVAGHDVKAYLVRDEVPNPVFSSNVESTYEMVDLHDGLWYRARSPMGVVNEGLWTVDEDGEGNLVLAVELEADCNLMLKAVVKSQVEISTKQIHKALLENLKA